jgi:hypothetical protein
LTGGTEGNLNLCNRHVTATETALTTVGNHNHHIHPKTVRKRLREFGLRACRPYIDFPLTHTLNSPVLTWRRYALTSPSRTVDNPSSISQTTDKTLYGGNIHTKLQSNLLPLTHSPKNCEKTIARVWSASLSSLH